MFHKSPASPAEVPHSYSFAFGFVRAVIGAIFEALDQDAKPPLIGLVTGLTLGTLLFGLSLGTLLICGGLGFLGGVARTIWTTFS